jgi:hypothetical protein
MSCLDDNVAVIIWLDNKFMSSGWMTTFFFIILFISVSVSLRPNIWYYHDKIAVIGWLDKKVII